MTVTPIPGEFGRHFDPTTGMHCWDGRETGLDFDVWAYDNGDGSFEVVVKQMFPNEMRSPGHSITWVARLAPDARIVFQAGESITLGYTAPRVVFESLPEAMQEQVWAAACIGFVFPDGREHHYDRVSGKWKPASS